MSQIRRGETERGKYWRGILAEWSRSGLSQAEYCRRRDIPVGNFRWWKRQLSAETSSGGVPARGPRKHPRDSRNSFVEIRMTDPSPRMGYEVVLSGGRILRLPQTFDPETLTRLIRAVEAAC